ncbi:hypothetical protein AB0B45_06140 [Nonomuraea sp. NPDC049152]|uniref:hypothetical protein n=1 Tax=Nonomuraea sp. NPDC049152 TaxID=3154350 RepID=UPI0033EF2D47
MSAHDHQPGAQTGRRLTAGLLTLLLAAGAAAATAGAADAAAAKPKPDRSDRLSLNHNETVLLHAWTR